MPPFSAPRPEKVSYVDLRVSDLTSKSPERVLAAVGDLMRRTAAHPYPQEELEKALAAVAPASVVSTLAAIDVADAGQALQRAAEAAFEAAFADSHDEADMFAEQAEAEMLIRDRVASIVAAAKKCASSTSGAGASEIEVATREIEARLSTIDEACRCHVRSLTGVNAVRRACLEELDVAERASAFWFSASIDADDLLRALGGVAPAKSSAAKAAVAAADLPSFVTRGESAKAVREGSERFDDAEASALYRSCLGTASPVEKAFVEARASRDPGLRSALDLSLDVSTDAAPAGDETT